MTTSMGGCIENFCIINDYELKCEIKSCPSKIVNGLRRVLIGETPTMAIDLVEIFVNEASGLHDEFIAHRLGLIPMDSNNVEEFKFKEECGCEYRCKKCCALVKCDVTNNTNDNRTVTTSDLIVEHTKTKCVTEEETSTKIPLVKLAPGKCIKFNAYVYKGIGNEHAKWNPVCSCICTYTVDKNADKLTQYDQETNPKNFEFYLETSNNIKAKRAFQVALNVMIQKIIRFKKTLNVIKF